MATLLDSYAGSSDNDTIQYNGNTVYVGQSFITPNDGVSYNLDSCKFTQKKVGSPTGNMYAQLYAHTGTYGVNGKPTGSALATSDAVDISTLSTSYAVKTFSFSGAERISLSPNTNYCIVIKSDNGDASNYLNMDSDGSSPSHGGNLVYAAAALVWSAYSGIDMNFEVYGESPETTVTLSGATVTWSSGGLVAAKVVEISGAVVNWLAGAINAITKWSYKTKPTTTWTEKSKPSTSWTYKDKT